MKSGLLIAALVALLATASACGDDDEITGGRDETPTATEMPTEPTAMTETAPEPAEPTATTETAPEPAEVVLPREAQLPDEYPSDIAPIPEGAYLTRTEIRTHTEEKENFIIVEYLMKDSSESVVDFYEEEITGDGWSRVARASSRGGFRLEYETASADSSVTVWVDPSDDYEGYTEVTVHISVPI